MRTLRRFLARLINLAAHRQNSERLRQEIEEHIALQTADNVRAGLSPAEARRQALLKFGAFEAVQQDYRSERSLPFIETTLQDLRYGLRTLLKSPGFTTVAILTLALGIGANTAIFSLVRAVLLSPLPFHDASRLVLLHEGFPKIGYAKMEFSPPDLVLFEREQKSFAALGSFQDEQVDISAQSEPERITAARVSSSLFPMFGARPILGRTFAPEEDAPGHALAILSYSLWQRRYGGSPNVIGQVIQIDRQPYVIIGVMPPSFAFPLAGLEHNGSSAGIWIPMAFTPGELQNWGGSYSATVVGRLRPGVTLNQARAEAASLAPAVLAGYPSFIRDALHGADLDLTAYWFQNEIVGPVRTLLLVLMAAVSFVLLIACANVATLLLSRAAVRRKEMAIRRALGASRLRLIRQILSECMLLALTGGALGVFLAFWARELMLGLVPSSIPLPDRVPLSPTLFVFALAVSILAAALFGLAPAFQVSSASVQASLQESGRTATSPRSHRRLQAFFVVAEFSLALVLLTGAGLLIRSFVKLLETNPGFRSDHLLTVNVPLTPTVYSRGSQVREFYEQLLARVSNVPGVRSASLSNDLPLEPQEHVAIAIEGRDNVEAGSPEATYQSWVLGDYFQTTSIPLLQGRWFTPEDRLGSQPVAIVSLFAAQTFWPGQNPIGKRVRWGARSPAHPWETVVGVVGNVNDGDLNTNTPSTPHIYRPYGQLPDGILADDPFGDWRAMNVVIRTSQDPTSLTSAVLAQVHALDSNLAVADIRTMTQVIRSSVAAPKFDAFLLGAFAAIALFLSAIGIYGVIAYMVAQQTHEIGIRLVLGARPRDVVERVLLTGVRLAGIGAAFGLVVALGLTRLMKGLLYGVSAVDPLTFLGVVVVLVVVALVACYVPARRAVQVDPMVALRHE
jgi:predicted permease